MLWLLFVSVLVCLFSSVEASTSPNIIIFQPDDFRFYEQWNPPPHLPRNPQITNYPNGYDLPNTNKLRTDGVILSRAYAASPACGTSRYSTITGRYPSRSSNSRNNNAGDTISSVTIPTTKLDDESRVTDGNDCSDNNAAALFSKNGYRTGMIGKWHLTRFTSSSYSYSGLRDTIKGCGFDYAEGLYAENLDSDSFSDGTFSHNMEWVTAKAIEFIDQANADNDPFFLYFNPTVPHGSGSVLDAIQDFTCRQTPEGLLPVDPVVPYLTKDQTCDQYRQTVLDRTGSATNNHEIGAIWIDDAVGALYNHLNDLGILDDTIILFQMDHGQEGKNSIYEVGSRMASFFHYPNGGFTPGSTFDGMVFTSDLLPTFMDFANLDEASAVGYYKMDGTSWKNAIGNAAQENFWKNERCFAAELEKDRAVVCGCDKYIRIDNINDSLTATKGSRGNLAVDGEQLFRLCDSDNNYLTSPSSNPEANAVTDDPTKFEEMRAILTCHLLNTNPDNTPDYDGDCFPTPPDGNPTTSAPSSMPDPSPTISPTDSSGCLGTGGFIRTVVCIVFNLVCSIAGLCF